MIFYVHISPFKGVFYLLRRKFLLVILIYIAMQLSSVVVPLLSHAFFGTEQFKSFIYTYIVAFIIGIGLILYILRENFKRARELHPLTWQKALGWIIAGFFLAWAGQMVAVLIELEILN